MLFRKAEEDILPTCLENGIGVIVPLTSRPRSAYRKIRALVTDSPGSDKRSGYEIFGSARFDSAYSYVEKLSSWAADRGRDIVQLAIAWTLAHPAVTSSIVGAKTPEQVLHNASAAEWTLTESEITELDGSWPAPSSTPLSGYPLKPRWSSSQVNVIATKIDSAAASSRSGRFQTRQCLGRVTLPNFHPLVRASQGHRQSERSRRI